MLGWERELITNKPRQAGRQVGRQTRTRPDGQSRPRFAGTNPRSRRRGMLVEISSSKQHEGPAGPDVVELYPTHGRYILAVADCEQSSASDMVAGHVYAPKHPGGLRCPAKGLRLPTMPPSLARTPIAQQDRLATTEWLAVAQTHLSRWDAEQPKDLPLFGAGHIEGKNRQRQFWEGWYTT